MYQETLRQFFESCRLGKEDKPCYWSLFSTNSRGSNIPERLRPIEMNNTIQDMDGSIDMLNNAIDRHGPGQRAYFVVILRTAATDNGFSLCIPNPHYHQAPQQPVAGIGHLPTDLISQQLAQQQKLFELRLDQIKRDYENQRKIEDLQAEIEYERNRKNNWVDKVIAALEPHLSSLAGLGIGKLLGGGGEIAGENETDEEQAERRDEIDWRSVRDSMMALKQFYKQPEKVLADLITVLQHKPELASVILNVLQQNIPHG